MPIHSYEHFRHDVIETYGKEPNKVWGIFCNAAKRKDVPPIVFYPNNPERKIKEI